ncbi:MAG: YjjG family noncanonical pyrimidine nucleotidase [Oscillospiraceae bacterium]|nr:YjjG family noncanonical pyrimidine nucleotidase [Oscillospiraceae bacterium]
MARYNCLLMDVDGTLLDFAETERVAFEKTVGHFDIAFTPLMLEQYRTVNQKLWELFEQGKIKKETLVLQRWKDFFQTAQLEGDPAAWNLYYFEELTRSSTAYPGAAETLEELAEVATIAFITNGVDKIQRARLAAAGIAEYADEIFVSEKMGCAKPNRKFFDQALRRLGVSNRQKVLVAGDSLQADIKGGSAAGLDTCWVNFDEKENTTSVRPVYTVQGYEELKMIVYGEDGPPDVKTNQNQH